MFGVSVKIAKFYETIKFDEVLDTVPIEVIIKTFLLYHLALICWTLSFRLAATYIGCNCESDWEHIVLQPLEVNNASWCRHAGRSLLWFIDIRGGWVLYNTHYICLMRDITIYWWTMSSEIKHLQKTLFFCNHPYNTLYAKGSTLVGDTVVVDQRPRWTRSVREIVVTKTPEPITRKRESISDTSSDSVAHRPVIESRS